MAVDNYDYRNQASLGGTTQFAYDRQGLGKVVPVNNDKANAVNGLYADGKAPVSKPSGNADGTVANGQPVVRNAFQNVGGKGKTIGQRKSIQEQNNAASNDAFLQAAASDNLARRDNEAKTQQYNADVEAYKNGQLPEMPKSPDTALEGSNMEQFRSSQRQNEPEGWGGNSNDPKDPAYQKPDNRSAFQKFRDSMYDEEKIRKRSDTQAKVLAVGDALRNIGNLYYVGAKDASPQKFGTDFATAERERYEQGRQNRDATAYKMYQADLAQKAQEAERQRKDLLAQSTMAKDKSQMEYNEARTNKTLQDMKIDASKYPFEIKSLIADAAYKAAHAEKEGAEAAMAALDAKLKETYGEQEAKLKLDNIKSQINMHNASATASRTSAALNGERIKTERVNREYKRALTSKVYREMDDGSTQMYGSKLGGWTRGKTLNPQQKSSMIANFREKGLILPATWSMYNTVTEDADGNKTRKLTAEDIIASVVNDCPADKKDDAIRILKTYGYKEKVGEFSFDK